MAKSANDWRLASWKAFLAEVGAKVGEDNLPRMASSFSYFALLSMAPFLVFAVTVGGLVMGSSHVTASLLSQAKHAGGTQLRDYLASAIASAQHREVGVVASTLSLLVTFWGASNLFLSLDDAVNSIWKIKPKGNVIKMVIGARFVAFLSVLLFGAVMVGWLILDSVLGWISAHSPTPLPGISFSVTILFLTLAFSLTMHALPQGRLRYRDVWPGAIFTALFFAIFKGLLSLYFTRLTGIYTAAGGVVALLLWMFYSSLAYFFGVEITYVYAHRFGSRKGIIEENEPAPG